MQISNEYLSVTEAAEMFGVTRQRMHALIKTYQIKSEKVGKQIVLSRKNLSKIPSDRPNGVHLESRKK